MSTEETIIAPAQDGSHPDITFESPIVERSSNPDVSQFITPAVSTYNAFKPLKSTKNGPVGNYYAEIHWGNGFENWPLVRFSTPMDGSCLFHAISNSFFEPYHEEKLHNRHVSRNKMVAALRRELAEKLKAPISDDPNAPRHYDILNGGNTSAFAQAVPEFALSYMQAQLDSYTSIGYGYMEFIGNALNKDIYILEAMRHDIYVTDELPLTIKGDRNSIVLYYMNGHYELVGLHNPEDEDHPFKTHFSPNHSLIRFLNVRVRQIVGR